MWGSVLNQVVITLLYNHALHVFGFGITSRATHRPRLASLINDERGHPNASPMLLHAYPPRKNRRGGNNDEENDMNDYDPVLDEPQGRRGDARNWIEKTSPTGIGKLDDSTGSEGNKKDTDGNYDLGINGVSFRVGDLSTRMYDTLMSVALKRFPPGTTSLPSELEDVYKLYAMDITAKEAVKAALEQNGLELAISDEELQDEGSWGDIDSVQLIDSETENPEGNGEEFYDSLQDAVEQGDWTPGQAFNFVARNVPSRLKEMDISDILQALDPDGEYKDELKQKGLTMPDEDVETLRELGKDCERRANISPRESQTEINAYVGDGSKGYAIIKRSDLLLDSRNPDGSESVATLMHVMDAFVNHGCLIVDLSDGGTSSTDMLKLSKMWDVSNSFFETITNEADLMNSLPGLSKAEGAGSAHAVAGFGNYDDGCMQFLETRIQRGSDEQPRLIPNEVQQIIGNDGEADLYEAFQAMSSVGKDLTRIAVAAANMEYDAFMTVDNDNEEGFSDGESADLPFISGLTFEDAEASGIMLNNENTQEDASVLSSNAAALLADELIDDGTQQDSDDFPICMSPHRVCRYRYKKKATDNKGEGQETFGAHTDTSFVTIVPVAQVSGLEVFDESADRWLRPEKLARFEWQTERKDRGLDIRATTETIQVESDSGAQEKEIPWHSRYLVVMPGELLQMCTRNEVPASVHRVVTSTENIDARLSCPALLRARAGVKMDSKKYFGGKHTYTEINGMSMENIHNALQPSSYRQ